jgi:signal transduction histidine kinase
MKWLPFLRLASIALIVATFITAVLALQRMSESRRWAISASNGIMTYSLAEQTLQVDLLTARAGLLRNYDPVNADLVAGSDSLADLERLPMRLATRSALHEIIAAAARQETLVEQFKSRNALLQNSLTRFSANGTTEIVGHDVLSAWILKLTLDTSAPTVREARAALEDLPPASAGTAASELVSHARLLVAVLPEIDRLLHSIRGMRMADRVRKLQMLVRAEAAQRAAVLRHLQVAFGVLIVLLAAIVTALVLVQRQRTRELQAQADNERLSAAIAMPLIDTGHATFAARVQAAVDRLASHLGAKRLRLTVPGAPNPAHFSAPGGSDEQEWFCRLVQAANASGAWVGDKVVASRRGQVGHPAMIRAMLEAGIDDLVLLRTAEPCSVIIGYEPEGAAFAQRRDHMAGLASAIVAIAHGARREMLRLEREHLERTVARAGRMETIGAMASGVAHNFNNITGAIRGFAEMGQGRTKKGSSPYAYFGEILGAVERARDLVDEILRFAKQGRSTKRPTDLLDILHETVRLLYASAAHDGFRLLTSDEPLRVIAAGSELQQVFLNIANNAAQASGGRPVTIRTRRASLSEGRQLSHGRLGAGKYVIVSICDLGPGIAEAAWNRLFEPFFTMKASGTGLGLSSAWEIVQDHGGTIEVANLAPGARFSVWLPESGESVTRAIPGDGARILLLGQSDSLAAEEELVAELGYEPVGFPSAAGIASITRLVEDCDAVLIAAYQSEAVIKLANAIADVIGDRPMVLATPEGRLLGNPLSAAKISYPLRREELADLLPQVVRRRLLAATD